MLAVVFTARRLRRETHQRPAISALVTSALRLERQIVSQADRVLKS
jgi:hypothetical protein